MELPVLAKCFPHLTFAARATSKPISVSQAEIAACDAEAGDWGAESAGHLSAECGVEEGLVTTPPTCKPKDQTCVVVAQTCTTKDQTRTVTVHTCIVMEQTCNATTQTCNVMMLTCVVVTQTCTTKEQTCAVMVQTCNMKEQTCTVTVHTCTTKEQTCIVMVQTCTVTEQTCAEAMQVGKISGFVTICPKMEQSGLFEVVPLLKMDSCIHNDCLSGN